MLKSTAMPMNRTAKATEMRLRAPTATAAKAAVIASPATSVPRASRTTSGKTDRGGGEGAAGARRGGAADGTGAKASCTSWEKKKRGLFGEKIAPPRGGRIVINNGGEEKEHGSKLQFSL